jgi:hypothetical protein
VTVVKEIGTSNARSSHLLGSAYLLCYQRDLHDL